jgi:hypothetical protein
LLDKPNKESARIEVTALENGIGMVMDNLTIEREPKEKSRHVSLSEHEKGGNLMTKVCKKIIQLKHT